METHAFRHVRQVKTWMSLIIQNLGWTQSIWIFTDLVRYQLVLVCSFRNELHKVSASEGFLVKV